MHVNVLNDINTKTHIWEQSFDTVEDLESEEAAVVKKDKKLLFQGMATEFSLLYYSRE